MPRVLSFEILNLFLYPEDPGVDKRVSFKMKGTSKLRIPSATEHSNISWGNITTFQTAALLSTVM